MSWPCCVCVQVCAGVCRPEVALGCISLDRSQLSLLSQVSGWIWSLPIHWAKLAGLSPEPHLLLWGLRLQVLTQLFPEFWTPVLLLVQKAFSLPSHLRSPGTISCCCCLETESHRGDPEWSWTHCVELPAGLGVIEIHLPLLPECGN